MKCPVCCSTTGIGIDMHSDGYADNLLECSDCEAVWLVTAEDGILLLDKKVA
ncbi:hypothetical protein [Geobacter sp. DSM 9736]|uniref:hypothetical protein n=1 Tax=Geobacter sp. DSM 9736 TaxID=1277350 RepID=UPI000B500C59|nr:hypothetical protein [Geobacter sp. DSM 9736]SNB44697.1 hypothetical protein SAMN06269301_0084 [Geobacter sp. DSM 9736]